MFYDSLLLLAMWFMGMAIALLFSHGEAIVGNPLVTTRNPNNVVFTCVAFSGAAIFVRLKRPWSPER